MSAVVADVEENKIIHTLALHVQERRRQIYGPGSEDTGWPLLILSVMALAFLILIIGIFMIGFAVFGYRKTQKMYISSRNNVIETIPKVIEETPVPIEDRTE